MYKGQKSKRSDNRSTTLFRFPPTHLLFFDSTMTAWSYCKESCSSKRSLLALLWTLVTLLTAISFIIALIFTLSARNANKYADDDAYAKQNQNNQDNQVEMAVTSRAMAFAALWTAVLSTLMAIFGTVILGWQSPTGQYYTCCSSRVHRTTPLALGSFIGSLIMFANLTLVCSVLFGEFEVSDSIVSAAE
jgi:hypothetical protein